MDSSDDDLKYATNDGGNWVVKIIDSSVFDPGVSGNTDIGVDSVDEIHIAYMDAYNVRYATNR